METNKMWLTLDEVLEIAQEKPEQQIWCVCPDSDFLMSAGDILSTIGSFNWNDVKFGFVSSYEDEEEDEDAITLSKKEMYHQVEILKSGELGILKDNINAFLKTNQVLNIVNIDLKAVPTTQYAGACIFIAIIHYIKED